MDKEIHIKGNLYTSSPMDASLLKKEGVEFIVSGDAFFKIKEDEIVLGEDDMFVEDIFKEYDVKDITII